MSMAQSTPRSIPVSQGTKQKGGHAAGVSAALLLAVADGESDINSFGQVTTAASPDSPTCAERWRAGWPDLV